MSLGSVHSKSYCSQPSRPLPPVHNVEEGVTAIQLILERGLLCKHDVDQINQIYQTIDLLERKIDNPSRLNSGHALDSVIEKVRQISNKSPLQANDIISLYHLQNFVEQDIGIKEAFAKVKAQKPLDLQEMADQLPFCESEEQFKADVAALLDKSTSMYPLNQKIDQFRRTQFFNQEIQKRKIKLDAFRDKESEKYPVYLAELLSTGYLYLYDHLIEIRQKELKTREEIQKSLLDEIEFSSLARIVLETQNAVIQKVESSIPAMYQHIVFLLGGSGAGKSTTLCFLSGDELELKDFSYESRSDKNRYIGHAQATSFTFLPSVEVVKDFVIVDFPGFDDTNGQLISLGMELALKALVLKYQPKILILEAITNIEGRYAAAAQLSRRLDRLFDHKDRCILGITKYSKDPDFIAIKAIEEQQKREFGATDAEKKLETEIQMLEKSIKKYNDADDIKEKAAKDSELKKLQQEREQKQNQPLPDTEAKKKHRIALEEKERELLSQIGLNQSIRLDNLKNPLTLNTCFEALACSQVNVSVNNKLALDAHLRRFLVDRFAKQLKPQLLKMPSQYDFHDVKYFRKDVLDFSLIHALLSRYPKLHEIGVFLHLPEIDPTLARDFDCEIAGECISKYMRAILGSLNISFMNKVIEELLAEGFDVGALKVSFEKLTNYILGLLGKDSLTTDSKKAQVEWDLLQKRYAVAEESVNERFQLPSWAQAAMVVPLGVPFGIYGLYRIYSRVSERNQISTELIRQYTEELSAMESTLRGLKEIENLLIKKEEIALACNFGQISLESHAECRMSIQTRISKVRQAYGEKDWDTRIAFFRDKAKPVFSMSDLFWYGVAHDTKSLTIGASNNIYFLMAACLDLDVKLRTWLPIEEVTSESHFTIPDRVVDPLNANYFRYVQSTVKSAFKGNCIGLFRDGLFRRLTSSTFTWPQACLIWVKILENLHSLKMESKTPLGRIFTVAIVLDILQTEKWVERDYLS